MTHLPNPDLQAAFYENVPLKRGLAWVIDTGITLLICLGILLLTGFLALLIFPIAFAVVGFFYRIITLSRASATWGMRAVAIEMRGHDGTRFDTTTAFLHTLGFTVCISLPILQVISAVLMLTQDRGQGLTDQILGTVALNRRSSL